MVIVEAAPPGLAKPKKNEEKRGMGLDDFVSFLQWKGKRDQRKVQGWHYHKMNYISSLWFVFVSYQFFLTPEFSSGIPLVYPGSKA